MLLVAIKIVMLILKGIPQMICPADKYMCILDALLILESCLKALSDNWSSPLRLPCDIENMLILLYRGIIVALSWDIAHKYDKTGPPPYHTYDSATTFGRVDHSQNLAILPERAHPRWPMWKDIVSSVPVNGQCRKGLDHIARHVSR